MIPESEVSLSTLAAHLENSGWEVSSDEEDLILHSESGLAFSVSVHKNKFVGLCTYLPFRSDFEGRVELLKTLSNKVFMVCFSIPDDSHLRVVYYMSYSSGLILSQFARIVKRYAGLIDFVCSKYDPDGLAFSFGEGSSDANDESDVAATA